VSAANESDRVSTEPEPAAPSLLSVVKGNPTAEELAALVIVLAGFRSKAAPAPARRGNQWSAYWRSLHAPLAPGPGSWRQSARV
jgi:hypothetical protein